MFLSDKLIGQCQIITFENIYILDSFWVKKKFHNCGYGQKLFDFCLKIYNLITDQKPLVLIVHNLLLSAIHIYRKYGFVEINDPIKFQYIDQYYNTGFYNNGFLTMIYNQPNIDSNILFEKV